MIHILQKIRKILSTYNMTSESSTLKAYEYELNFFFHVVFPFKIIKKWHDTSWFCNSMASDPYSIS